MKRKLASFAAFSLCILLAGCTNPFSSKTPPPKPTVKQPPVVNRVYVDETQKVILRKGFPTKLVPLYTDAKLVASSRRTDPLNNVYYSASLLSSRDSTTILQFYKTAMAKMENIKVINGPIHKSLSGLLANKNVLINVDDVETNGQKKTLIYILVSPPASKQANPVSP